VLNQTMVKSFWERSHMSKNHNFMTSNKKVVKTTYTNSYGQSVYHQCNIIQCQGYQFMVIKIIET